MAIKKKGASDSSKIKVESTVSSATERLLLAALEQAVRGT